MVPALLKIVIAGGFGVGKTTLVGAVSEIPPLTTEEYLTTAGAGTDCLTGVEDKTTTTVSMDFGRISFRHPQPMVLFLFGTPGQERFLFLWDDLTHGAIGAVVLVDTRRLEAGFTAVDYFEQRGLPFVVAVNDFDDAPHRYTPTEVRHALELPKQVPVVLCDARDTRSAAAVLTTLVSHALSRSRSDARPGAGSPPLRARP
ncbi:GTP-binding protein [Thermomonospora cellulosilytica]|uniref:Signal recognition particle receptor subunit beta n=1 Tax=Thermomonospora cellulosilytica TaxID=1411118 RepID=A0A7W3MVU2_9ACTN|nr:ATP/GTP-binding protein [Thermomonospora cellulosilytica]MBA9002828.1 signal recognition particle receptor subunit beta [Thermomonospora cellulosilytica]